MQVVEMRILQNMGGGAGREASQMVRSWNEYIREPRGGKDEGSLDYGGSTNMMSTWLGLSTWEQVTRADMSAFGPEGTLAQDNRA